MTRYRADVLIVMQGLAPSRTRAQALILAGAIGRGTDRLIFKPGELIDENERLHLHTQPLRYVSRGGLKLEAGLSHFGIDPHESICLDVGASTGGFTDCLLQHGAKHVYAVDVGYGQLAWNLRQDPRVTVIERANIRYLPREVIPVPVTVIVVDVSFISLRLVLPNIARFAAPGAVVLALVKPQFEVGRTEVPKGGVIKSSAARERVLAEIVAATLHLGIEVIGTMESPLLGAAGNLEYLLMARFPSNPASSP